jgi:hypothetical protein
MNLVDMKQSSVADKIANDTFRTMSGDKNFADVVKIDSLSRLLNAFVWKGTEKPTSRLTNLTVSNFHFKQHSSTRMSKG